MAKTSVPKVVIVKVAREQGGIPAHLATCANPACNRRATDPHHWLFKQSSGLSRQDRDIPERVLHNPINIVLLCRLCHDNFGQTERMVAMCFKHKVSLGYQVIDWINDLLKWNLIKVRPDLGAISDGKKT